MDLRAGDGEVLEAHPAVRRGLRALAPGRDGRRERSTCNRGLGEEEKQRVQSLAREAACWNVQLSACRTPPADVQQAFDKAARDLDSYRSDLYTRHTHLKAHAGHPKAAHCGESLQMLVPDAKSLLIEYVLRKEVPDLHRFPEGLGLQVGER